MGAFDDWDWGSIVGVFTGGAAGSGIVLKIIYELARFFIARYERKNPKEKKTKNKKEKKAKNNI